MAFFSKDKLSKLKQLENTEKKYTLLLVDDEEPNLRILKQMLENEYNILTANDGQEAIDLIKNHSRPETIHLIISDQRMPNKTGIEFFKETIDTIPKSVRIILTGFTDADTIIGAINEGQVYKFFSKPFEPKDLKVTIERALEAFELEAKNNSLIEQLKELNSSLERKVEERTKELTEINELQNGLISTIVHDLKKPLNNILMFSTHIHKKCDSLEEAKETAGLINSSSKDMAKMVKNLLEISIIERGLKEIKLEKFDIIKIIKNSTDEFSPLFTAKRISVEFISDFEELIINLDYGIFKRIIDSIFSNAIKFSPFDKSISIRVKKTEDDFLIIFKDHGIGIKEEDMPKLFHKFAKLSAQPTNCETSTGLELYIVKSFVDSLNGKIWCESEYGKGSCFYLSFPDNLNL